MRIIFNGQQYASTEAMPEDVRKMYRQALAQLADADHSGIPDVLEQRQGLLRVLDRSESVLSTVLVVVLAAAAGAVIVFGSWMITHMDESSRSQGGVIYVGFGMLVVLAAIAGQFMNLWWRKQK
jgi:hypothetical protein